MLVLSKYEQLLGDGSNFGITLSYKVQPEPNGVAAAFIVGEEFIKDDDVCLILGDNIFYGKIIPSLLQEISSSIKDNNDSVIFGYEVTEPERYGVAKVNSKNKIIAIKEKPKKFMSDLAITGLYFFDNNVIKYTNSLKPSKRNEIEIIKFMYLWVMENAMKEVSGNHLCWLQQIMFIT